MANKKVLLYVPNRQEMCAKLLSMRQALEIELERFRCNYLRDL